MSEKRESRHTIEAIPFAPSKTEKIIKRWSGGQIVLATSIAIVLFTLWFLFTAKSVRMKFSAPTQAISLSGGFHIEFGNVFLLRHGEYEVVATAEGYETFSSKLPRSVFTLTIPAILVGYSDSAQASVTVVNFPASSSVEASFKCFA